MNNRNLIFVNIKYENIYSIIGFKFDINGIFTKTKREN